MQLTIAIDPGASGAIAVRDPLNKISVTPMPDNSVDVLETIEGYLLAARTEQWTVEVLLEKVSGYAGGPGQPGSAMFKFGRGYGFILGVLAAHRVPVRLVTPQQWQRQLCLGNVKDHPSKAHWKRHLRDEAARRFPCLKPSLSTADALLLLCVD